MSFSLETIVNFSVGKNYCRIHRRGDVLSVECFRKKPKEKRDVGVLRFQENFPDTEKGRKDCIKAFYWSFRYAFGNKPEYVAEINEGHLSDISADDFNVPANKQLQKIEE